MSPRSQELASIRSTVWFGPSLVAMLFTLVFSHHPRACDQPTPGMLNLPHINHLNQVRCVFHLQEKNLTQAHLRMGDRQNQQPPKIAHKTRCQLAEMQARKNGAPREWMWVFSAHCHGSNDCKFCFKEDLSCKRCHHQQAAVLMIQL